MVVRMRKVLIPWVGQVGVRLSVAFIVCLRFFHQKHRRLGPVRNYRFRTVVEGSLKAILLQC